MGKSKGRRHLGRPRHNWKHVIKTDEAVTLFVNRAIKLRIPYNTRKQNSVECSHTVTQSVSWLAGYEDTNQTENSGY